MIYAQSDERIQLGSAPPRYPDDQLSVADTVSCGNSSLEEDEIRPCNACPHCDDVCESPECQACVEKKHSLQSISPQAPGTCPVLVDRDGCFAGPQPKRAVPCYTPCQVRRHMHADSCWLVAGDTVYDATPFLKSHPGGSTCILRSAGGRRDCARDIQLHSKRGQQLWKTSVVGKLRPCGHGGDQSQHHSAEARPWWMFWP
jgi:hypothetical protein